MKIRISAVLLAMLCFAVMASAADRAPRATETTAPGIIRIAGLEQWLGGNNSTDELLPPEQAFKLAITVQDANTLIARFTPAKDYYLYRDRIHFKVLKPDGVTIAGVDLPRGVMKNDPAFGPTEIYRQPFTVRIALKRGSAAAAPLALHATWQGCNEPKGVCYVPLEKTFDLDLPAAVAAGAPPAQAQPPASARAVSGTIADAMMPSRSGGLWVMLALAAVLIVGSMYLRALDPLPVAASGVRRLGKGVGVIVLAAGVALLVGVLAGSRDPLQPLAILRGDGAAAEPVQLPFQRINSVSGLEGRLAAAHGRYAMLDFYADWCVSCKEMERFTFTDPRVQARLANVVLLQADVTANNADDKALLARFRLFGPPGIIFFDRNDKEVKPRVIGFQSADQFLASLDKAMPQ
ncbi:MAG TPA: protein-disulfide reductase DsbD domain-containing protein [Burkholderiales bacterium]|nr:protein-disulfide reductase DsbD domain-containing protein [Burkholderiales bacterium]